VQKLIMMKLPQLSIQENFIKMACKFSRYLQSKSCTRISAISQKKKKKKKKERKKEREMEPERKEVRKLSFVCLHKGFRGKTHTKKSSYKEVESK
jgi:hypothetical protein